MQFLLDGICVNSSSFLVLSFCFCLLEGGQKNVLKSKAGKVQNQTVNLIILLGKNVYF